MDIRKVKHREEDRTVIFGSKYVSMKEYNGEYASVVEELEDFNEERQLYISSYPGISGDDDGSYIEVLPEDIDLLIQALQVAKTWYEKKPVPRRPAPKK